MHILVGMIVPGRAGGIYVTEKALVDELRRRPGVTVEVFEFGSRKENESRRERITGRWKDLVTYRRLLRTQRPDVVYVNSSYNRRALLRDIGYAFLSTLYRVPLAVKLHGTDARLIEQKPWFWWLLTRLMVRWSALIPLLSTEEVQRLREAGFPAEKLPLVKNVVNLQRFPQGKVPRLDPPGILFIARFIVEKGLLDLLRAARILKDEGRSFRLYCVGDGPIRATAEALAAELQLGDSVVFTGQISEEEAVRYYLGSTVLVLPTYFQEGFPMTILQAVAAGLPIVTTRIRAAADHLKDPDNCLWVKAQDPPVLARTIDRLLSDPALRESMRAKNLALAREFAVESVADEYLQMFDAVTGPSHPQGGTAA